MVYATIGDMSAFARAAREGYAGTKVPVDFNAFLKIGIDNRVTCFVGKIHYRARFRWTIPGKRIPSHGSLRRRW